MNKNCISRDLLTLILLVMAACAMAQEREINLREWQFSRDSIHWQTVSVPHDWAISGPFDKQWDLQRVAITQNGEQAATEKSGRSGALPWIGEGWYRSTVRLSPATFSHAYLCFDGAMAEPLVRINGAETGRWAYGYNAFRIDATPFLRPGDNTITVHLRNVEESSRWYPGAGLYRPVRLMLTPEVRIDPWKVYVRTTRLAPEQATVAVDLTVEGLRRKAHLSVQLIDGSRVASSATRLLSPSDGQVHLDLRVDHPRLWTPETPYLYEVRLAVVSDGRRVASHRLKTGIRTVTVDSLHGFRLNGVTRKLQGVCLHHDLGPLGSAVNKAALIRQIKLMKDMGADAIRTAHNMPSELQMQLCDSLGMMVMAESFDMWRYPKCRNGYARFFDAWADRDMENLLRHHRNHPSIIMWSVGNEIPEQGSEEGPLIARRLQDICHQFDPSRPVTQGMDRAESALRTGFAQVMDVPGFNYRVYKYGRSIGQLPRGFILGSETASTVSSRGVYKFPVTWGIVRPDSDGQVSSYDVNWCSWSNLPEEDFIAMDDAPYTIGQFIWTGIDYLGEPTPYDEYWPSRSSYFGACDLAGLPKDRYYLYRSVWNRQVHTLHLLPHWTWPGREGLPTPVFCYTDWPEAELFVNGRSQGRRRKSAAVSGEVTTGKAASPEEARLRADRYRLIWDNVVYEPGELKVIAYDAEGREADRQIIHTAGRPAALALSADRTTMAADGDDLIYVTVSMTDADGNLIPDADAELSFLVEGAGRFRAVCNGDATSLEPFTEPRMRLFHGQLVVTVQSLPKAGPVSLTVTDASRAISGRIELRAE